MFLEVHLLQNFALSNLNRDDTGAPKSCIFAGSRRSRISSQCLKRAVRTVVRREELIPSENLAYRTKKVVELLSARLVGIGLEEDLAKLVSLNAVEGMNFKLKKEKTEYLLMIGEREICQLAALCLENVDKLSTSRDDTKKPKVDLDKQLVKDLLSVLDGGDAVDMALFGRMVATYPDKNIDAAVQMAHAFSTNVMTNEFDFFSAVDDLQLSTDDSGAGAAHIDTMLYNSSCYYRYANLDMCQLQNNLSNNKEHTLQAMDAFLEGMVKAVPTGKQTSSAAQNPPALILVVIRETGLWSLANAFTSPVNGNRKDMVVSSALKLLKHWDELTNLYGTEGILYAGCATYLTGLELGKGITEETNYSDLKGRIKEAFRSVN